MPLASHPVPPKSTTFLVSLACLRAIMASWGLLYADRTLLAFWDVHNSFGQLAFPLLPSHPSPQSGIAFSLPPSSCLQVVLPQPWLWHQPRTDPTIHVLLIFPTSLFSFSATANSRSLCPILSAVVVPPVFHQPPTLPVSSARLFGCVLCRAV